MEQNNKYWEGCYVKEEKWIKYCKGVKRKTYCGLPVQIILPNDTVVTPEEYWKSKEKKKCRWKPKKGEKYYFITLFGNMGYRRYDNDRDDNYLYSINNIFKTKEEAEEHKKKLIYQQQYKDYAMEHNDEIDWENEKQYKYYSFCNVENKQVHISFVWATKTPGQTYFTNTQDIWDFIKLIGEDNFKKYILEVE